METSKSSSSRCLVIRISGTDRSPACGRPGAVLPITGTASPAGSSPRPSARRGARNPARCQGGRRAARAAFCRLRYMSSAYQVKTDVFTRDEMLDLGRPRSFHPDVVPLGIRENAGGCGAVPCRRLPSPRAPARLPSAWRARCPLAGGGVGRGWRTRRLIGTARNGRTARLKAPGTPAHQPDLLFDGTRAAGLVGPCGNAPAVSATLDGDDSCAFCLANTVQ
jgi:hypothetical protein